MKKIAIIGGGIVGLALAYKLSKVGVFVHVFEKEDKVGLHQSGRNSGVLHCGLYYQSGSLKAKLSVNGIREMTAFCETYSIPHDVCGKVVIANSQNEVNALNQLAKQGKENGLNGLNYLSQRELKIREPFVKAEKALLVPQEGIVDYNAVMQKMVGLIKENNGKIAAIKMEVSRNERPKDDYLQKVRDLASDNNIVLIFDECTSGFRETFGGLHKKYDVEPDIAIFGKALGNGYAISACIGRKEFMQAAQKTFISSTFWTERIGPAAALKTLEVMEKEMSWDKITNTGIDIVSRWEVLAKKYNLKINTWGLPALAGFSFHSPDFLLYKTFITQEMLKKGYLASNSIYVCTEHSENIVNDYFKALEPIFAIIKEYQAGNQDISSLLESPICHSGFKRLN